LDFTLGKLDFTLDLAEIPLGKLDFLVARKPS
jgi:hypothetical protein